MNETGIEIQKNVSLAALTTMKVGGEAEQFATVSDTHQLIKLVRWARKESLPYLVLGGGSNVLISDRGVRGLVIHNRCRQVRIDQLPYCEVESGTDAYLFAESGAATAGAARISTRAGLTGFEWAVSVPGTIGGAVVNNAGAHGGEVQDNLEDALVLVADNQDQAGNTVDGTVGNVVSGEVVTYRLADLAYAYRRSSLKHEADSKSLRPAVRKAGFDSVVLSANFRLRYSADAAEPKARADQFLAHRRSTQPSEPSLGSMFMNPPNDFAGRLIEQAGLKGFRIGGAQISPLHANFMINAMSNGDAGRARSATASDILALVEHTQAQVAAESGIRLVPEIQLVGEWD